MRSKNIIAWAAVFGMVAVIFGALGAHALKARLDPESLKSFETAVRYQAWHAIALLAVAASGASLKYLKGIVVFWILGIFLFSGSIYLLSTSSLSGLNVGLLGPVTPIGGLLFITGWVLLFISAIRANHLKR